MCDTEYIRFLGKKFLVPFVTILEFYLQLYSFQSQPYNKQDLVVDLERAVTILFDIGDALWEGLRNGLRLCTIRKYRDACTTLERTVVKPIIDWLMLKTATTFPKEAMRAIVELGYVDRVVRFYRKRQSKLVLRAMYSKSEKRRLLAVKELYELVDKTKVRFKNAVENRKNRTFL